MTTKNLLIALTGNVLPKGELKLEMMRFHNRMVGKSDYFKKVENENTSCGSCIQRVRSAVWKWYHFDESSPNYKGLEFTGQFGVNRQPKYVYHG